MKIAAIKIQKHRWEETNSSHWNTYNTFV